MSQGWVREECFCQRLFLSSWQALLRIYSCALFPLTQTRIEFSISIYQTEMGCQPSKNPQTGHGPSSMKSVKILAVGQQPAHLHQPKSPNHKSDNSNRPLTSSLKSLDKNKSKSKKVKSIPCTQDDISDSEIENVRMEDGQRKSSTPAPVRSEDEVFAVKRARGANSTKKLTFRLRSSQEEGVGGGAGNSM